MKEEGDIVSDHWPVTASLNVSYRSGEARSVEKFVVCAPYQNFLQLSVFAQNGKCFSYPVVEKQAELPTASQMYIVGKRPFKSLELEKKPLLSFPVI